MWFKVWLIRIIGGGDGAARMYTLNTQNRSAGGKGRRSWKRTTACSAHTHRRATGWLVRGRANAVHAPQLPPAFYTSAPRETGPRGAEMYKACVS